MKFLILFCCSLYRIKSRYTVGLTVDWNFPPSSFLTCAVDCQSATYKLWPSGRLLRWRRTQPAIIYDILTERSVLCWREIGETVGTEEGYIKHTIDCCVQKPNNTPNNEKKPKHLLFFLTSWWNTFGDFLWWLVFTFEYPLVSPLFVVSSWKRWPTNRLSIVPNDRMSANTCDNTATAEWRTTENKTPHRTLKETPGLQVAWKVNRWRQEFKHDYQPLSDKMKTSLDIFFLLSFFF